MFLYRLSCFSSSVLPRSHPVIHRDGFKSSTNAPKLLAHHPWWGFSPQNPRRLYFHPPAQKVFTTPVLHHRNTNPGIFRSRSCSLFTAANLMSGCPDGNRGPPYKRRKSTEEKRRDEGDEGREAAEGASGSKAKDGRKTHQHQDPTGGRYPQSNQHFMDGSRDRGKVGTGKDLNRENLRDKDGERTKYWHKPRKDGTRQDETTNRERSHHHQQGRYKDYQTEGGRTQSQKSKYEQELGHAPKPDYWFKEKGRERDWVHHRNTKGPESKLKDGGDGGIRSQRCHTTHPSNPGRVPEANRPPTPPGTSPSELTQDMDTSMNSLQRQWELSPACSTYPQPPGICTAFDFSVMSYNILSQELLQDNSYLYTHCNPCVLPWDYRLPNLLSEIQQHNADVLCLQEVQENHYETQIKPALQNLGYGCEYKKRTGDKPDGCAVFYKSSRLSLISSNPVEFFRSGDVVLDRDNVGLVVLLRPNDPTGQSDPSTAICVANTHLLYNPRRGDVKLAQLAILLAEISRLSSRPDGSTVPVVLCGDFNSTPWSPLYSFLTTGCLEYGGLHMGMVSGQENPPRGHRILRSPILSQSLGINNQCRYETKSPSSPGGVEGAISNLTVEDLATKAAAAVFSRTKLEHSLRLQSSYQHRLMPDGRPEVTTCHSHAAMTVDYILFTPDTFAPPSLPGARGLQLLGRLSLVGQSELEDVNGLPNHHHSSDHLPLLACFRLRR